MPVSLIVADGLSAALDALAEDLDRCWPDDPFASVPILLGDRRLESRVRAGLAHRLGVASALVFRGAREGLRAAAAAAAGSEGASAERWWTRELADGPPMWSGARLADRILGVWERRLSDDAFSELQRYLAAAEGFEEGARRLALASAVAEWMGEFVWNAPKDALQAVSDPSPCVPTPWLRATLADLLSGGDSPAHDLQRVLAGEAQPLSGPPLRILGLSDTTPTTRALLDVLGQTHPVSLFRSCVAPARWGEETPAPLPAGSAAARLLEVEEREREAWMGRSGILQHLATRPTEGDRRTPALRRWQQALRTGSVPDEGGPAPWDDETPSQLVPAWSARREVELLRDRLLAAFLEDRLEPRDVLVVTPDLSTYGPLVASLFSEPQRAGVRTAPGEEEFPGASEAGERQAPAIPCKLAGLGLSQTNPVAQTLELVVAICADRVTAPGLLALVALPPVQRRLGLGGDAAKEARSLLQDSGARWGFDGDDKAQVYGEPAHQNSVRFGLERLAVSAFVHDDASALVPLRHGDARGDLRAPMPASGQVPIAGSLAALTTALEKTRAQWREPETPAGWRARLRDALDRFTAAVGSRAWLRRAVNDALDEVFIDDETVHLDVEAVRQALRARFELPLREKGAFGSAVAIEPLRPRSLTPHPVVVLLGMNSGTFPRGRRVAEWEPPLPEGVHDPLALQRQAFADAVMAAGEDLWVYWTAREPKKGRELPPCTPVMELAQLLCPGRSVPEGWLEPRGRHAWSPVAVGDASTPTTFSTATAAASRLLAEARAEGAGWRVASPDDALPPWTPSATDRELEVEAFVGELLNPSKTFLYRRVGVYLSDLDPPLPDREPVELDHLDQWRLRDTIAAMVHERYPPPATLDDAAVQDLEEAILDRVAAEGSLPLEEGAVLEVRGALNKMKDLNAALGLTEGDREGVDHPVGGVIRLPSGADLRLSAQVPSVLQRGDASTPSELHLHQWIHPNDIDYKPRAFLQAWVCLLLARASGQPVEGARILGTDKGIWLVPWCDSGKGKGQPMLREQWLGAEGQALAERWLQVLAALWWQAHHTPLRLFKATSLAVAKPYVGRDTRDKPPAVLRSAAIKGALGAFVSSRYSQGDDADRWIAMLHPGFDPAREMRGEEVFSKDWSALVAELLGPEREGVSSPQDLVSLARLLWHPILASRRTESGGIKHWKAHG